MPHYCFYVASHIDALFHLASHIKSIILFSIAPHGIDVFTQHSGSLNKNSITPLVPILVYLFILMLNNMMFEKPYL